MWESLSNGCVAYMLIIDFTEWVRDQDDLEYLNSKLPQINEDNISKYIDKAIEMTNNEDRERIKGQFEEMKNEAYESYKEELKDCSTWVGTEFDSVNAFDYISDSFNINIYIIRDTTRMPYNLGLIYKERPSVLVLWLGDSHYESIGRLNEEKKTITRVFNYGDRFINEINKILNRPPMITT
jgi:hypothetical protein